MPSLMQVRVAPLRPCTWGVHLVSNMPMLMAFGEISGWLFQVGRRGAHLQSMASPPRTLGRNGVRYVQRSTSGGLRLVPRSAARFRTEIGRGLPPPRPQITPSAPAWNVDRIERRRREGVGAVHRELGETRRRHLPTLHLLWELHLPRLDCSCGLHFSTVAAGTDWRPGRSAFWNMMDRGPIADAWHTGADPEEEDIWRAARMSPLAIDCISAVATLSLGRLRCRALCASLSAATRSGSSCVAASLANGHPAVVARGKGPPGHPAIVRRSAPGLRL